MKETSSNTFCCHFAVILSDVFFCVPPRHQTRIICRGLRFPGSDENVMFTCLNYLDFIQIIPQIALPIGVLISSIGVRVGVV